MGKFVLFSDVVDETCGVSRDGQVAGACRRTKAMQSIIGRWVLIERTGS